MSEPLFGQIKSVVWHDARKEKPKCCGVACWEQYLKYRNCKNEMEEKEE